MVELATLHCRLTVSKDSNHFNEKIHKDKKSTKFYLLILNYSLTVNCPSAVLPARCRRLSVAVSSGGDWRLTGSRVVRSAECSRSLGQTIGHWAGRSGNLQLRRNTF